MPYVHECYVSSRREDGDLRHSHSWGLTLEPTSIMSMGTLLLPSIWISTPIFTKLQHLLLPNDTLHTATASHWSTGLTDVRSSWPVTLIRQIIPGSQNRKPGCGSKPRTSSTRSGEWKTRQFLGSRAISSAGTGAEDASVRADVNISSAVDSAGGAVGVYPLLPSRYVEDFPGLRRCREDLD